MAHQKESNSSEFINLRNAAMAVPLTAALILLDEVLHVPLWFSVPFAGVAALGVRYAQLKRAEAKQGGGSK